MINNLKKIKSVWHKEIEAFSKAVSVIILEGNVLDRFCYPEDDSIVSLREYLYFMYSDMGYDTVLFYDTLKGFYGYNDIAGRKALADFEKLPSDGDTGRNKLPFSIRNEEQPTGETAATKIECLMQQTEKPAVVIMDFSSRYIISPDVMEKSDIDSFLHIQKGGLGAASARSRNGNLLSNLTIMIVNKLNDLPAWFYLNNPTVHTITVCKPSTEEREYFVNSNNFRGFFTTERWREGNNYFDGHPEELKKIKSKFVAATDGLMYMDLISISKICLSMELDIKNLNQAVEVFKYGVVDQNPWSKISSDTMEDLRLTLSQKVLGQEGAIEQVMSVLERAAMGVSSFFDENSSKPKGILFFAGPTGTGKTQTAKIIAQKLFESDRSCRIFDMSEYRSEHSDQRLLGAPPGYVGYEAGGQLTNAVRENPFSVFLFDEIEKAHPSILDKFLQILGDGRLTDGMGRTVYFTDSLIIFTSNLGIYGTNEFGNRELLVDPSKEGNDYSTVKKSVTNAINSYFRLELQRAEILNRIGKNIVVFDFIRPSVADTIVDSKIESFREILLEVKGIRMKMLPDAIEKLKKKARTETMDGGRGIENMLEYCLINDVSAYIYRNNIKKGDRIEVVDLDEHEGKTKLIIRNIY